MSYKSVSGIYKMVNIVNGKLYIGSAVNIKDRWKKHIRDLQNNKHHSPRLQNSYNKYKEENFLFEIIEEVPNKELLIEREQYWIDYYQSYDDKNGYNICPKAGSNLGIKLSEEAKKIIGESSKGRKHTEETKKRMSEKRKGKKHTEESKQRMSVAQKGRIVSEESRRKNSESQRGEKSAWYGRKHTEEEKRKISEGNKGKHLSEETKRNISESRKGLQVGEKNPSSKLNWEQVREIREKYIPFEYGAYKLAKEYKVSKPTILDIIHNKSWKEEIVDEPQIILDYEI